MTLKAQSKQESRGRPELAKEERRVNIAQFRCTMEERKKLEIAARRDGKKLSNWLRDIALDSA